MYFLVLLYSLIGANCQLCDDLPPGLNQMRRGVDITEFNLIPMDSPIPPGFRNNLLDFTCKMKRKWRNPMSHVQYTVPDQVHISSLPSGKMDYNLKSFEKPEEYMKHQAMKFGLPFKSGMFLLSSDKNAVHNRSSIKFDVTVQHNAYEAYLMSNIGLKIDPYAEKYLNELPENYDDDVEGYSTFVKEFGTHYINVADFGGILRHFVESDKLLLRNMSKFEIQTQVEISLNQQLQISGGYNKENRQLDSQFRQRTNRQTRVFGGTFNFFGTSSWERWLDTAMTNPWMVDASLKSISTLVNDVTRRKSVERAVEAHLDRTYLQQLRPQFAKTISMVDNKNAKLYLTGVLSKIDDQLKTGQIIEHDFVDGLIERDSIPDWFIKDTKLCLEWFPIKTTRRSLILNIKLPSAGISVVSAQASIGQILKTMKNERTCGLNKRRHVCAKPGSMTAEYRDNTNGITEENCMMTWTLQVASPPAWFHAVRLCFRYVPTGRAVQCGDGGGKSIQCVHINEYIPYYEDSTDDLRGGCKMSWKLEAPEIAGKWMDRVSLCMFWRPDGNEAQCQARGRKLCAKTNEWTDYFLDDTNMLTGGCRMKWGLMIK